MIRAVEFDAGQFAKPQDCIDWLNTSPYSYLTKIKGFTLRHRKIPIFLSWEKRPVWSYWAAQEMHRDSKWEILRPEPLITLLSSVTGAEPFGEDQLPPLLQSTVEKLARIQQKKEETLKRQQERKEQAKHKRKEEREAKKRKSRSPDPKDEKEEKAEDTEIEASQEDAMEPETPKTPQTKKLAPPPPPRAKAVTRSPSLPPPKKGEVVCCRRHSARKGSAPAMKNLPLDLNGDPMDALPMGVEIAPGHNLMG